MKSKKGALPLTLEQLTKLILLSIIMFLVFIPLGVKLYAYYFPSVDKDLRKTLDQLVIEAEDLGQDIKKDRIDNPEITVPIFLKKDSRIMAYDSENAYIKCHKKSCLCIFQIKKGIDRELSVCKILKGVSFKKEQIVKEPEISGTYNIHMVAKKEEGDIFLEIN